jgi:hypothetical protein
MLQTNVILSLCVVLFIATNASPAFSLESAAPTNSNNKQQIAAERIKTDLFYLADDLRQGRRPGTKGFKDAAEYVAKQFQAAGISPGGQNASWFQEVRLRRVNANAKSTYLSITESNGNVHELLNEDDYIMHLQVLHESFDLTAAAVFVGYGISNLSSDYDDYAGLDLNGKIAVVLSGAPEVFDNEQAAHFGDPSSKHKIAASHGAIGVITILVGTEPEEPEEREEWDSDSVFTWIDANGSPMSTAPEIIASAELKQEAAEIIFEGAEHDFSEIVKEIADKNAAPRGFNLLTTITLRGSNSFDDSLSSVNVLGFIEGVGPQLKDELIVFSGHLDHLGAYPTENGEDGIYNGAADNAMGMSMMIETARMFMEGAPPRRSVAFVAVTAEELGLLGSDYFANYPTIAENKKMVASINFDMGVITYEFTDIVAFGADRSTLGPIVQSAVDNMGLTLSPDPMREEGIFIRSDQYSFVKQGVPSLYLFPGFANGGEKVIRDYLVNQYHQPSDDLSMPFLYEHAARFSKLNYLIGLEAANADQTPAWVEGDFFGTLFNQK